MYVNTKTRRTVSYYGNFNRVVAFFACLFVFILFSITLHYAQFNPLISVRINTITLTRVLPLHNSSYALKRTYIYAQNASDTGTFEKRQKAYWSTVKLERTRAVGHKGSSSSTTDQNTRLANFSQFEKAQQSTIVYKTDLMPTNEHALSRNIAERDSNFMSSTIHFRTQSVLESSRSSNPARNNPTPTGAAKNSNGFDRVGRLLQRQAVELQTPEGDHYQSNRKAGQRLETDKPGEEITMTQDERKELLRAINQTLVGAGGTSRQPMMNAHRSSVQQSDLDQQNQQLGLDQLNNQRVD